VHHRLDDKYPRFLDEFIDDIIEDLKARDADYARVVVDACTSYSKLISVATHHGLRGSIMAIVDHNIGYVAQYLIHGDAAAARVVLETCPSRYEFIRVAAHHKLHDIIDGYITRDFDGLYRYMCDSRSPTPVGRQKTLEMCTQHCRLIAVVPHLGGASRHIIPDFITRDADGRVVAPAWTPVMSYRLSDDDAVNAWLWLIKGDGEIDVKVWEAIKAAKLLESNDDILAMITRLYEGGGKFRSHHVLSPDYRSLALNGCYDHAVATRNMNAVKLLLSERLLGKEVTLQNVQDVNMAKYLMEHHGATVVKTRYCRYVNPPLLHGADNVDIAGFLMAHGASVTDIDYSRRTPLHTAKNVDVARFLLENKARVHSMADQEKTPLHTVNDAAVIQLLLDHRADVDAVDHIGNTRLHGEKDPAVIACLLNNRANVNIQNQFGYTALHDAIDAEVVKSMLETLANLPTETYFMRTSRLISLSLSRSEVLAFRCREHLLKQWKSDFPRSCFVLVLVLLLGSPLAPIAAVILMIMTWKVFSE
jgi:ankyrin repeat protein